MNKIINIIGIKFKIAAPCKEIYEHIDLFMKAYAAKCMLYDRTISVAINIAPIVGVANKKFRIAVHRSKHADWNFDAIKLTNNQYFWPTHGLLITLDAGGNSIQVIINQTQKLAKASEGVFHLLRSIALYQRTQGTFLHASCIQYCGKGIAFAGQRFSGKTTLFSEMIINHNAQPVTNDRLLVLLKDKNLMGFSWPSYSSFCEGTLLNYEKLQAMAQNYKYQNSQLELKPEYKIEKKRIFPMYALSKVCQTKYLPSIKLDYIVLNELSTDNNYEIIAYKDASRKMQNIIHNKLFDTIFTKNDPSFKPWHSYQQSAEPDYELFNQQIREEKLKIFYLKLPIIKLKKIGSILNSLIHERRKHYEV